MDPAKKIIDAIGGHKKVATRLGLSLSRVYYWEYPRSRRGSGGIIPIDHWPAIAEAYAEVKGRRLDANDFLPSDFWSVGRRGEPTP